MGEIWGYQLDLELFALRPPLRGSHLPLQWLWKVILQDQMHVASSQEEDQQEALSLSREKVQDEKCLGQVPAS